MKTAQKARRILQSNALRAVERWNATVPIGSPVLVKMDSGEIRVTRTRSEAGMLGAEPSKNDPGHTAVVWVDGISGCYDLSRVSLLRPIGGKPSA